MAITRRRMTGVTPRQVFDVLRDGSTYGDWVVGARTTREVEPDWPADGTALHYTIGYRPLRKDGVTTSRGYDPDRRLELEAHAWPAGTAGIVITAEPDGASTLVVIAEAPRKGPAARLHNPVADKLISLRNVETLRRLERLARQR